MYVANCVAKAHAGGVPPDGPPMVTGTESDLVEIVGVAGPRAISGRDVRLGGVTPATSHFGAGKLKSAPSFGFWSCV